MEDILLYATIGLLTYIILKEYYPQILNPVLASLFWPVTVIIAVVVFFVDRRK